MKPALAQQRILLVDDEPNLRLSLATTLLAEGYQVIEARDGQEALEQLERHQFDLILTDIRMPRRSGIELFHEVRRRHPSLPVVMMTAFANEQVIEDVLASGVFTVVDKPFDMAPMLQLVATALANPLILIVDRVAEEATAILHALNSVGLRAEAAPDAATAIQLLQGKQVDACVLDLEMADGLLDAYQVEERLRSIRVIAITGQDHTELLAQTGQFASETCLRRPLSLGELVRSIARARQASMRPTTPQSASAPLLGDGSRPDLRHELSNRLLVIRASVYYLQRATRRSDLWQADPQVQQMFSLIEDAIRSSVSLLDRHGAELRAAEAPSPSGQGAGAQSGATGSAQPQVLIVDDTENNRRALQTVLEDCELRVDAVASLAQARELLLSPGDGYRLVVLDQHLKDGLGTDLVALIRQCQPAARILLLSGSASEETLRQEGAKVDAHLAKGRDIAELLSVVTELLA